MILYDPQKTKTNSSTTNKSLDLVLDELVGGISTATLSLIREKIIIKVLFSRLSKSTNLHLSLNEQFKYDWFDE